MDAVFFQMAPAGKKQNGGSAASPTTVPIGREDPEKKGEKLTGNWNVASVKKPGAKDWDGSCTAPSGFSVRRCFRRGIDGDTAGLTGDSIVH